MIQDHHHHRGQVVDRGAGAEAHRRGPPQAVYPDMQLLYKDDQLLDGARALEECGFTSETGRPQTPATVVLAFQADDFSRPCAWSPAPACSHSLV